MLYFLIKWFNSYYFKKKFKFLTNCIKFSIFKKSLQIKWCYKFIITIKINIYNIFKKLEKLIV